MLAGLTEIVGAAHVLTDPGLVAGYERDWTGRFRGTTPAVVRPGSVDEVAAVVRLCRELGVPIVLQGGNTGLVGGGVPLHGEVVLSLRRLAVEPEVDAVAGQATVSAGTAVAAVHAAAAAAGLAYAVDLASRDSATLGGTIATNAGGLRVLPYGDTRAQVLGVEAVLGSGSVIRHLGGLTRDNTGYHLPSLLCGSEGTLGVVTRARVRLVPPVRRRAVALVGFASLADCAAAAAVLRREAPGLLAVELMLSAGLSLVLEVARLPLPVRTACPAYLLVELGSGERDRIDPVEAASEAVAGLDGVVDAAVAADQAGCRALWAYRERHTEAINSLAAVEGAPVKMDVTLPPTVLAAFLDEVPAAVAGVVDGARVWLFGHVADGNVHVNVTGVGERGPWVEDAVFSLVASRGGSISAEHGIGAAKRRWLPLNRSAEELEAFRAVKAALDPDGILNPHVLHPPSPA